MKKITRIILLTVLLLGIVLTTQVMALTVNVSTKQTKVEPGDTVKVTVTFSEKVSSAQFSLNYDTSKFQGGTASAGTLSGKNYIYAPMIIEPDLKSVTFTFTAKTDGKATFSVSNPIITTTGGSAVKTTVSGTPSVTIETPKEPDPEPDPKPETKPEQKPTTPTTPNTPSTQTPSTQTKPNTQTQTPQKQEETNKEPSFTSVKETVYATSKVNVRSSYSTDSSVLGQLNEGDSVTRTGKGSNGWSKITYNGKTGYVKATFLTTTKPGEEEPENVVNEVTEEVNAVVEEPVNELANELENELTNTTANELDDNSVMEGIITEEPEQKDNNMAIIIGSILAALVLAFIIFFIIKRKKDKNKEQQNKGWD